jgi:hypothetical protein
MKAADAFNAKKFSRLNTHFVREYVIFASAQFLRKWYEQRPSSQVGLDLGEVRQCYMG